MEKIKIGTITKPQALKGEFRVKPTLLNLKSYKTLKEVYIDNNLFEIEKVTIRDTFVIFKVNNINTCEDAEKLRNHEIFAEMDVEIKDNSSLIGYDVRVAESIVGKITDINNYGSKDIISVSGERELMFPLLDNLIENRDDANKIISLNNNLFGQIVVYED